MTLAGSLACALAATPAIGMVSAGGSFQVDGARVTGNATLFEGAVIETDRAPSELHWLHGGRMILGADSRGKVCRDRLVLERGQGQIAGSTTYPIEAATLRILAAQPDSTALVTLDGPRQIHVTALAGSVRVTNSDGVLVANIAPGKALELEAQVAGAAAPTILTGAVLQRDGHYLLTDETTGVTVELKGEDLAPALGMRVQFTGTIDTLAQPVAGATEVVRVLTFKVLGKSVLAGAAAGGAAKGAAAAVGATTAGGLSTVATVVGISAAIAVPAASGIAVTQEDKTSISR
ncbi:MAG: hypothetical protein ACLQGV_15605 [Bryobacteraceae bacterium]